MSLPKTKIMIVDDSLIIRKIIEKSILGDRFELTGFADNGKKALELFRATMPHIVTLDITLPELNGLNVLEEMVRIKPDVKIIVISGLTDKATAIYAVKLGAKSFIPKPFSVEDVQKAFSLLAEDA